MGNLEMRIEEPPWIYPLNEDTGKRTHVPLAWTNDSEKGGRISSIGEVYVYLPSVFMHEFGHAAGLTDLYGEEFGDKYAGFLMRDTHQFSRIPSKDIEYIRQLYRNDHPGRPH